MNPRSSLSLAALLLALATVGPWIRPPAVAAAPSIELVTIEPGDAIWGRFGHIGLRVIEPGWGMDWLFSWGYAPFGNPDFVWGYLNGTQHFELAAEEWDEAVERYSAMDRTIERVPLNLTRQQANAVFSALMWNYQPENRAYVYDHLYDNCSTRLRDFVDDHTGSSVSRVSATWAPQTTYRGLTLGAARGRVDALILLDLLSGPSQEVQVTGWGLLYLPDHLRAAMAQAEHGTLGGALMGEPEVIYTRRGGEVFTGSPYLGRWVVIGWGVALALGLLALGRRPSRTRVGRATRRATRGLLMFTGLFFGLVGAALWLFASISQVRELMWNENMLLFWPLDLGLIAVARRWKADGVITKSRWLRAYLVAHLVVICGVGAAKLGGILMQDNWVFVGFAGLCFAALAVLPPASDGGGGRSAKR